MEIKRFVPKEDLPAKERAISILLDMLDDIHERMKKAKGLEINTLSASAANLAGAISSMQ